MPWFLCLVEESLPGDAIDDEPDDHLAIDDLPERAIALGPGHDKPAAFPVRCKLDVDAAKLLEIGVDEGGADSEGDVTCPDGCGGLDVDGVAILSNLGRRASVIRYLGLVDLECVGDCLHVLGVVEDPFPGEVGHLKL